MRKIVISWDRPEKNWLYRIFYGERHTNFLLGSESIYGKKVARMKLADAISWIEKDIGRKLSKDEIRTLKHFRSLVRQGWKVWLQEIVE